MSEPRQQPIRTNQYRNHKEFSNTHYAINPELKTALSEFNDARDKLKAILQKAKTENPLPTIQKETTAVE